MWVHPACLQPWYSDSPRYILRLVQELWVDLEPGHSQRIQAHVSHRGGLCVCLVGLQASRTNISGVPEITGTIVSGGQRAGQ